MTLVAALIAKDGMVFISDGRVNSLDRKIIKNDQIKQFELSPLAVILPAGGASDNIEYIMSFLKRFFAAQNITNVNDVILRFVAYCEDNVDTVPSELTPVFIVAGYNLLPAGEFEPKIYYVSFKDGSWGVGAAVGTNTFIAQGAKGDVVRDFLADKYSNDVDGTLHNRILLALQSIELAKRHSPESIGGQTSLWSLQPPNSIHKYSQKEVVELGKQL